MGMEKLPNPHFIIIVVFAIYLMEISLALLLQADAE